MHSSNGRDASAILATIRAALPGLSPSQQRLARLAADAPYEVARLTITEFAQRGETSPASVTRLCRALGLDSYAQLRMELAVAGQQLEGEGQRISGDLTEDSTLSEVVEALGDLDARSIKETARLLDLDALEAVVEAIGDARHVYLMGAGSSHVVAVYLELKLRSLGVATTTFYDMANAVIGIALAEQGDVMLLVTPTGIARESVPVLTEAKRRGCVTVALTGNPRSAVTGVADHCLMTVQGESDLQTGVLSSRVAELFVTDCITSGLVVRRHDRSVRALAAVEEALQSYW